MEWSDGLTLLGKVTYVDFPRLTRRIDEDLRKLEVFFAVLALRTCDRKREDGRDTS